jgi:glycosyltransferase involved in cell wall biosynthesis
MTKVTFIIPVYNAEKYLHACLDSVVNQTLTDIQIICVNDGSSDSCPQILDEYAAKDNRFKIIHQQNTGIAGARNAAYPHIKGEYTLFVDNDDTIEPDLCEKVVAIADAEQADTTYFFSDRGHYWWNRKYKHSYRWYFKIQKLIEKHSLTENDYLILLEYPMIWTKLWRSCFLLDNDIRCPTGQYSEDTFMHWKTLVHHPKMALLPEVMYHYRRYPLSTNNEPSKKYGMGLPATYIRIKEMLQETGNYHEEWKRLFLYRKLWHFRATYSHLPVHRQAEFLHMVKEQFNQDEQEYLQHKNGLKRSIKVFYYALLGSRFAVAENVIYFALRRIEFVFRIFRDQWKRAS